MKNVMTEEQLTAMDVHQSVLPSSAGIAPSITMVKSAMTEEQLPMMDAALRALWNVEMDL